MSYIKMAMLYFIYPVITVFILSACALFAKAPHENFKDILNHSIGRNIDKIPYYQIPSSKKLIGSKELSNGNIERKYQHWETCIYYVEFDPKTRIIVGVRFEGKGTDCVINP